MKKEKGSNGSSFYKFLIYIEYNINTKTLGNTMHLNHFYCYCYFFVINSYFYIFQLYIV